MNLERAGRHWTEREDTKLALLWGSCDITVVGHQLGRTARAVSARALRLKLGPPSRGNYTIADLMRETGYAHSRIMAAISRLGIPMRRALRQSPRQRRHVDRYAITDEQRDSIVEFLARYRDGDRVYRDTGLRTERGRWACGIKPPACLGCGRSDRPHRSNGRCKSCAAKMQRQRKRETRVSQTAAA